MAAAWDTHTQIFTYAQPRVDNLGSRESNAGSALGIAKLIAAVLGQEDGPRSDGCDNSVCIVWELGVFADEL